MKHQVISKTAAYGCIAALSAGSCAANAQSYWTGPYIGATFGVSSFGTSGVFDNSDRAVSMGSVTEQGGLAGVHLGYNFDVSDWILGVEAEISTEDTGARVTDKVGSVHGMDVDTAFALSGKAGKVYGNTLVYGTAGLAVFNGRLRLADSTTVLGIRDTGVSIGIGSETMVAPNLGFYVAGSLTKFDHSVDLNGAFLGDAGDAFNLVQKVRLDIGVNWYFSGRDSLTFASSKSPVSSAVWNGFHVGGIGALGGVNTPGIFDGFGSDADMRSLANPGPGVGVQAGWMQQRGNWVFGITGDVSQSDWDGAISVDSEGDAHSATFGRLATVRVRAGKPVGQSLIYGTLGVAALNGTISVENGTGSASLFSTGYVAGVGIETFVTENISFTTEGLFLGFNKSHDLSGLPDGDTGDNIQIANGFQFRAVVNYHFKKK